MTKDEMKDRISMALKDPVLQQGFECICKENAKLKERNGELLESCEGATMMYKDLCKAKEIIRDLLSCLYSVEYDRVSDLEEAEQFLKSKIT